MKQCDYCTNSKNTDKQVEQWSNALIRKEQYKFGPVACSNDIDNDLYGGGRRGQKRYLGFLHYYFYK